MVTVQKHASAGVCVSACVPAPKWDSIWEKEEVLPI